MKMDLKPLSGIKAAEQAVLEEINTILTRGASRFADAIKEAARKFMTLAESTRETLKTSGDRQRAELARSLERVAAKEMHPRLAIASCLAARHMQRMDYPTQERLIDERIPVALPNGDHVQKMFEDLSRDEVNQVFELENGVVQVRDLAGQKAWLAAKRLADAAKAKREKTTKLIVREGKWKAQNGVFYPLKERFSLRELDQIVAEMRRIA